VPLSENEQRQLEAIERAFYADDPKFAAALHTTDLRSHARRRLRRAIALVVIGVIMLLLTFASVWVGIAGFGLMFIGVLAGLGALRRLRTGASSSTRFVIPGVDDPSATVTRLRPRKRPNPGRSPSGGWRERVEERWRRRWEDRET